MFFLPIPSLDRHGYHRRYHHRSSILRCAGSGRGALKQTSVTKKTVVDDWRRRNMYFGAVGFVFDVKRGPFWEHSRILYDISGVTGGWAKINKVCIIPHKCCVADPFRNDQM